MKLLLRVILSVSFYRKCTSRLCGCRYKATTTATDSDSAKYVSRTRWRSVIPFKRNPPRPHNFKGGKSSAIDRSADSQVFRE